MKSRQASQWAMAMALLLAIVNTYRIGILIGPQMERDSEVLWELFSWEHRELQAAARVAQKGDTSGPLERHEHTDYGPPVGTLNGYDLFHVKDQPRTKVHCVGDTYQEDVAWNYRSCEYELLCFDMDLKDFVIYEESLVEKLPLGWHSSTLRNTIPSSSIEVNSRPRNKRITQMASLEDAPGLYYPLVLLKEPPPSYFFLDVALVPFFRYMIGFRNPGHLLWQELASLYTLLEHFGREDEKLLMVPMPSDIPEEYYRSGMADLMNKFGAKLMGMPSYTEYDPYWHHGNLTLDLFSTSKGDKSYPRLVCSKYGLTGVGEFGYHETHFHNGTHHRKWGTLNNVLLPVQHGKGSFFRRFRSFMMQNVKVNPLAPFPTNPSRIVFSQNSSTRGARADNTFEAQLDYLQSSYLQQEVHVTGYSFPSMSIEEQIHILSQTRVLVTPTGGGSAPAIFLPRGSHLILLYDSWFLDWDYWNNIPDIHVHWIPIEDAMDPKHLVNLKLLVDECLGKTDRISKKALNFTNTEREKPAIRSKKNLTSLGLCEGYAGILYISKVFKKAATGTFFFQSIVDSLLYAERHNLYPFIWVDKISPKQPCFDRKVHGIDVHSVHYHLGGTINDINKYFESDLCMNEPGAPSQEDFYEAKINLTGNGIWQNYFLPTAIPFNDKSCQEKPVYEMMLSQIIPGMHYCSEHAVRGWIYPNLDESLYPKNRNQTMYEWLTANRRTAARLVAKHFHPQPWLLERIHANSSVENGGECLGVHIRLTDKGSGRQKRGIEAYLPYVEAYVQNSHGNSTSVFLATDDSRVLEDLLNASSVLKRPMIRFQQGTLQSNSTKATFYNFKDQRHRLNTETLVDIYSLSKCSYLVHGYSAVSEAAVYINPTLNDFSVNIDDPLAPTPKEFGRLVQSGIAVPQ